MAETFDASNEKLWYFAKIQRTEAQRLLYGTRHGRFLVRDSTSCPGDYVLSVSENAKVSHYIINREKNIPIQRFKIGDQVFDDLVSLIEFYKIHYLDTTTLVEPCPREPEAHPPPPIQPPTSHPPQPAPVPRYYKAIYDFPGRDADDLPFRKGEVLTLIRKDEENWWTMKNTQGREGSVPVPYIEKYSPSATVEDYQQPIIQRTGNGPVRARVIQQRIPSAYDPKALRLDVGDVVIIKKQNISGQWEGEVNGRTGTFPCTYVEIIPEEGEFS
ncbi:crk-like protein [Glandiceps talaboti]